MPRAIQHTLSCFIVAVIATLPVESRALAQVDAIAPHSFMLEVDAHQLRFNYDATHEIGPGQRHAGITHLFIMIHGTLRNADVYHPLAGDAARAADALEHTAVLTPQFLMAVDLEAHDAPNDTVYWTDAGWKQGDLSRSTDDHPRRARISAYAALEQLLLGAVASFPDLQRVTLAGHSAGGQHINRFAAGNRAAEQLEARGVTVRFIVSNPSSYIYFTDERLELWASPPTPATDMQPQREPAEMHTSRFVRYDPAAVPNGCTTFNRYRFGLDGVNQYMAASGEDGLRRQYGSRHVIYLLSADDNDPEAQYLDRSCGALLQGPARYQRGVTYYRYMGHLFGEDVYDRHFIMVVPGVAHTARRVFNSPVGLRAVFADRVESTEF